MLREMKQLGYAGVAAVALLGALGVQDAEAQRRGARGARGVPASGVERALRLGDEIGLSQEQRDQLESIRTEILESRSQSMARLMELRSEVQAGLREPEAIREEMEGVREARRESRNQIQERMESVLTDAQREQLRDMRRPGIGRRQGIRGQRQGIRGDRRGSRFDRRPDGRSLRSRRRPPSN